MNPSDMLARKQVATSAASGNRPYRRRQHISVQVAENGFVIHQDGEGPYGEVYPRTFVFTNAHEVGRKLAELLIAETAQQAE